MHKCTLVNVCWKIVCHFSSQISMHAYKCVCVWISRCHYFVVFLLWEYIKIHHLLPIGLKNSQIKFREHYRQWKFWTPVAPYNQSYYYYLHPWPSADVHNNYKTLEVVIVYCILLKTSFSVILRLTKISYAVVRKCILRYYCVCRHVKLFNINYSIASIQFSKLGLRK